MTLTSGKLAGLKAISNSQGVVAALALDQRGIVSKAIAREKAVEDVPASVVIEFKEIVTEVLAKHASAILLDPEYGLPAAKLRGTAGLMIAYERSAYYAAPPRLPDLYDVWSVRRLKEAGADCIKILLHYVPDEAPAIHEHKCAWIERIGDECRANDIPFVLELLGYDVAGGDGKDLRYAKGKPQIVIESMREFGKDRYGVDLLKVELPVLMKYVPETSACKGEHAYTLAEAQQYLRDASAATSKPFVYLSAGVSNAEFIETLRFITDSRATYNGVLCGRATWQDGMAIYARQGAKALEQWLSTEGVENIARVNVALKTAEPLHERVAMATPIGS
ncbi:tagatose 1,6-diphosphate aldolase [Edaphobacter acidisoli]|uniref:tagatose-bisphosphate aldolase n=1 Tax=Edaphobacter acidisoli TaxID=2040573 RepID=A0A916REZ4_9BACT|nr:tagatose 1,6-diphosphate aldolase [Edaphobacter acidisoli]GGA53637.1 tagatose 1,6-diphosphate aldolase [Edaphobacter acidisoli]